MKKITLLLATLIIGLTIINAKTVDVNSAKTVANSFLTNNTNRQITNLSAAYVENAKDGSPVYFVFNVNQNDGFIIISGDDAALPVLGYATIGKYDKNNLPPNFAKWMEGYKQQILYIKANDLQANDEIQNQWNSGPTNKFSNAKTTAALSPLLTTTWNQGLYYNDLCPGNTYTGCVATAMAQVMKYWNHPAQGKGFHSYDNNDYGTLSANFGNTSYDWASMSNNVTSTNDAVATLMYHCGVSLDMKYGTYSSGAQTLDVVDALKTYFGYSSSIQGLYRTSYTDDQWKALLKTELDASRPVQYAGSGTGGGHSFVCDGYDNYDFFHFNWGWGGAEDGYFDIDALNPGSLGNGGGSGQYNSNQRAVIGIQPAQTNTSSDLQLSSNINVTPSSITTESNLAVTVDVENSGSSNFTGDLTAAVFTDAGVFVAFVETLPSQTISNGYSNNFTFNTTGIITIPGTYVLYVYYRLPGDGWALVDNASYTNPIILNVAAPPNNMKLYSNLNVSANPIIQNQSFTVMADVANYDSSDFNGWLSADIFDSDGNWIQTINEISGVNITAGYYQSDMAFTTFGLSLLPGSYYIALFSSSDYIKWDILSNDLYINPISIDIVAPPIFPDVYESNNTASNAYNLNLNFSGNVATKQTTGSNLHYAFDNDFYRIVLAAGYNYKITARVHDSYSSGNWNTYTCDVLFSYDTGNGADEAFDDIMPGNITVNNGGIVTFQVAPFFVGEKGTYLLDLSVTRTIATAINEIVTDNSIRIFPVPTSDAIFVEFQNADFRPEMITIQNTMGQKVKEFIHPDLSSRMNKFDVSDLSNGIYFIQVNDDKRKIINKKFVINR